MDCRKAKKLINLYLDGEADSSQEKILFSHIGKCKNCQARFWEIRDLHRTIKSVSTVKLPLDFRNLIMDGIRTDKSRHLHRPTIFRTVIIMGSAAIVLLLGLTVAWRIRGINEVAPDIPEIKQQIAPTRVDVAISVNSNSPKPEGTAIAITASPTEPGEYAYSFDWDNDGSYDILEQLEPSASYVWNDDGIYTVGIGLKDRYGNIHRTTISVEVTDLVPTAEFAWTSEAQDEGSKILFTNASASLLDSIAQYSWDFGDALGKSIEQNPTYIYKDNGVYEVILTVTDDDGSTISKNAKLEINNIAPSLAAGTDQVVDEGTFVNISHIFTDPGTADSHTATIDWGDGTVETKILVKESSGQSGPETEANGTISGEHVYADNGTYHVTLTVTDDDGASASEALTVTVNNVAPLVLIGADQEVSEGALIGLDSSIFIDLGNHDAHTATIDWGDGKIEAGKIRSVASESSSQTVGVNGILTNKHIYTDNGTYEVTLTVIDDDGASSSKILTIKVSNTAPSVVAGVDQRINEGTSVSLASSVFNDPGNNDTHTATIDWGDGTVEAGTVSIKSEFPTSILGVNGTVIGNHTYSNNGLYTVTLKIKDDDGAYGSDALTVAVNNQPPAVGPISIPAFDGSSPVAVVNTTIEAIASFEDPGTGDNHTIEWDWGDGSILTEAANKDDFGSISGKHTYNAPGVYRAMLKVIDSDGDWNISSFEYIVVYDPDDEFVAGSGQIGSPPEAYISNPEFSGQAIFGFVSKYKKGADISTSDAELRFHVANIDLHSTEVQWFAVTDSDMQFSGRGTINGLGDYGFILTATDGGTSSDKGVDRFRVRIWEEQNIDGVTRKLVVYDNQVNDKTDVLLASVMLKQKENAGIPRVIFGYAMAAFLVTQLSIGIGMALQYLTK